MINPNFMNQGMFSPQNVPTTKELWKNEKSKYRVWIVLFGLSILAILVLSLVGLILNSSNKGEVINNLISWGKSPSSNLRFAQGVDQEIAINNWANRFYRNDLIITPSIKVTILFIGLVLYISTIIDCYRKKTFSVISKWSTFVIGVGAIIGVYQLFTLYNGTPIFSYAYGIYNFIGYIAPILVFIFVSVPINKIRNQFLISERITKLKNSPEFKNFQNQMKNNQNPMASISPFINPAFNQTPKTNDENEANVNNNSNFQKLKKMKIIELKAIAKKLSISGYNMMKKDELIDSILRVSGEKTSKNE